MRKLTPRVVLLKVLLLAFVFSSCTHSKKSWKKSMIKADCPKATYVKVFLPTCNSFSGLEVAFVNSNTYLELNLDIHSLQFPCDYPEYSMTSVQVTIRDELYLYNAYRLLGGQRLNMPYEACDQIVSALISGDDVEIRVGRYEATLLSKGFAL